MEIDLLYVADCPNRSVLRDHLEIALARTGQVAVIRERQVSSAEDAVRLGMSGSPTILIEGRDPFSDNTMTATLSCRLYRCEAGYTGAPSVDQLVEAISEGTWR